MTDIKKYEPLWGSWYVDEQLGEGSFGRVYKVHKEEFGRKYEAAVKIISIPQSESDIIQAKSEGLNEESARSYFQAFVTDIIQEIDLMSALRGNTNIVSLEDHKVIERQGEIGWDILIRMELLSTLSTHITIKPMTQAEVVKLGIHICRALELCAKSNTIHRDIKPDNIFVSQYGDYKLGDFGIARQIERTMSGLSKKGTYPYMAPEVFRGDEYGASVDTYSLGIVMYRFLNKNRAPFLPTFPKSITPHDREEALRRRMSGEPLPQIQGISEELNAIVLKACAYDRAERFKDATEMKTALENLSGISSSSVVDPHDEDSVSMNEDENDNYTEATREKTQIIFSRNKIPTSANEPPKQNEPETKVPEKLLNNLALLGSVFFGILSILTFCSNNKSDIFSFFPLYALCISQFILKFRNKVANISFIIYISCYLLFSILVDFQFFDYYFLILLLCLLSIMASHSKKLQIISCVTMLVCTLIFALLILHTSQLTHYTYVAGAIAIPLVTLMSAPVALCFRNPDIRGKNLVSLKTSIGTALLISLHFIMPIALTLYTLGLARNAQLFYYFIDASFPGFSPEHFSWWHHGRPLGVILQFFAFTPLSIIATANIIPEQFLCVLNVENRRRVIISTLMTLFTLTLGIFTLSFI